MDGKDSDCVSFDDDYNTLSSLLGTSPSTPVPDGDYELFYDELKTVFEKIYNCGSGWSCCVNVETGEERRFTNCCDNRICLNPVCKKHRGDKFRSDHDYQVRCIEKNVRKAKAFVFTTPKWYFPFAVADFKRFAKERMVLLRDLLNIKKHPKYGSKTFGSIHMEIAKDEKGWYLHFHVVCGFIENLELVRLLWNAQIRYEAAKSVKDVSGYVGRYASKTPLLYGFNDALAYLYVVYKLKMHDFIVECSPDGRRSMWVLLSRSGGARRSFTYGEMLHFLEDYFCDNDKG